MTTLVALAAAAALGAAGLGGGTGGTVTGSGQVLKLARPDIKIVSAEPENAMLLSGKEWAPHKIQGWTPDFVPEVLNKDVIDETVAIGDADAIATAQRLASEEGIFCGISSGATMFAALSMAKEAPEGSTFCVMLPDTGERYLSTPLFENISPDSDEID